jgi:hypothetical protein
MEISGYSLNIEYHIPCEDNDPRNEWLTISRVLNKSQMGEGFYLKPYTQIPEAIKAEYRHWIGKFIEDGSIEQLNQQLWELSDRHDNEIAVKVSLRIFLRGGVNGAPRNSMQLHIFRTWDKQGRETFTVIEEDREGLYDGVSIKPEDWK